MPPDEEHSVRTKPQSGDLESYRRLVELQKQMIQLSQQHEQTKRECAVLREHVAREISRRLRARPTLRQRLRLSTAKLLKSVPGFASSEAKLGALAQKEASC